MSVIWKTSSMDMEPRFLSSHFLCRILCASCVHNYSLCLFFVDYSRKKLFVYSKNIKDDFKLKDGGH